MDLAFWDELFESDSSEDVDKLHEIAKIVSDNVRKNQQQTFTLHGEKNISLELYGDRKDFDKLELYTTKGKTIIIDGSKERSYCLYGLNSNIVVFKSKVNHILIRKCYDTKIYLNGGTISGIDILKGSNVSVRTPKHNFTNIEHSSDTHLGGSIDDDTLIYIEGSVGVFVNCKDMNINPFSSSQLKLEYKEEINTVELSSSPIERNFPIERPTKLFLKRN